MLSLSNGLKLSDEVQDKLPRKTWRFPPLTAWLAFTDGLVHAELRGQCGRHAAPGAADRMGAPWAPRTLIADLGMPAAA